MSILLIKENVGYIYMKTSKKILIVIFAISIFLIAERIRVSANTYKDLESIGVNSENLIEYINDLDINKNDIEDILDKGKDLAEDIKDKTNIRDFKLSEILNMYKDVTSIANKLNLNIDFSFKDGNFSIKDKNTNDVIFEDNVNEINKYYELCKDNMQGITKEVLGNINNKEIIENIEEAVEEEFGETKETLSKDSKVNQEYKEDNIKLESSKYKLNRDEENKNVVNSGKALESNKNKKGIMFSIFIVMGMFFTILISYIKFRK